MTNVSLWHSCTPISGNKTSCILILIWLFSLYLLIFWVNHCFRATNPTKGECFLPFYLIHKWSSFLLIPLSLFLTLLRVEIIRSYVYLGITFTARVGKGFGIASFSLLKRQCHQVYFQEPQTKGWLFYLLMTTCLKYGAVVWALGLSPCMWIQSERLRNGTNLYSTNTNRPIRAAPT